MRMFRPLASGFTVYGPPRTSVSSWINHSFTNVDQTYMSAPVELNAAGNAIGHSHIVIQQLSGSDQMTPTDTKTFVFFDTSNDPAVVGIMTANVTGGLPVGYYRLATLHSGANHQPSECDNGLAPPTSASLTDCRSQISSRSSYC